MASASYTFIILYKIGGFWIGGLIDKSYSINNFLLFTKISLLRPLSMHINWQIPDVGKSFSSPNLIFCWQLRHRNHPLWWQASKLHLYFSSHRHGRKSYSHVARMVRPLSLNRTRKCLSELLTWPHWRSGEQESISGQEFELEASIALTLHVQKARGSIRAGSIGGYGRVSALSRQVSLFDCQPGDACLQCHIDSFAGLRGKMQYKLPTSPEVSKPYK